MRIAVDWDGTCEYKYVQDYVLKWISEGHYVEIVTTRYEDPSRYPWYVEKEHKDLHKELFKFATSAGIKVHFTNFNYKYSYVNDKFDYLVDDNRDEDGFLKGCKFINIIVIHDFDKMLEQT